MTSDALGTVLAAHKPGQTVKVKIVRQNGSSATRQRHARRVPRELTGSRL